MKHSLTQVKNLSCDVCGPEYRLTGFPNDSEDEFHYTNEDGTEGWMYNIDCDGNSLVCRHCGRFYMTCQDCSEEIQRDTHEEQAEVRVVLCQFLGCGDTRSYAHHQIIDFSGDNVNYVRNEDIELITGDKMTGPDGGNYMYWKCRMCGTNFHSCDK